MSNIIQTDWATGRKATPRPQSAGAVHNVLIKFAMDSQAVVAASDIVEMGILPPGARIVGAKVWTAGTFTAITADIGILSGAAGDKVSTTRALTADLIFDDADLTTTTEATKIAPLIIPADFERGIGMVLSANSAAAASKGVWLSLSYVQ